MKKTQKIIEDIIGKNKIKLTEDYCSFCKKKTYHSSNICLTCYKVK